MVFKNVDMRELTAIAGAFFLDIAEQFVLMRRKRKGSRAASTVKVCHRRLPADDQAIFWRIGAHPKQGFKVRPVALAQRWSLIGLFKLIAGIHPEQSIR